MNIPSDRREQVRERADFACEYCGVTEADTGGELTIDHIQPQAYGGNDETENLAYCCIRCNGYKSDYWPQADSTAALWNPRQEQSAAHFLELADGRLYAVTPVGTFTLSRLRLNRSALVLNRLRRRERDEQKQVSVRLRDLLALTEQLQVQQETLLAQNRSLLQEQQRLINLLLEQQHSEPE